MTVAVARMRAILGVVFALAGLGIGIQLLLSPGAFRQKMLGLAFAVVLTALGIVRVRAYLIVTRRQPPA